MSSRAASKPLSRNRLPAVTARLALATAENQMLPHTEVRGEFGQRYIVDQCGPHTAQITLRRPGVRAEEEFRDYEIKHGITEEFEAFVVAAGDASVRQSLGQQGRVGELVVERPLEPGIGVLRHATSAVSGLFCRNAP